MYNTNHETGVAYGVVSLNSIDPELAGDLMYRHGIDADYESALADHMSNAHVAWHDGGGDFDDFDEDGARQAFADSYESYEPSVDGVYEGVKYAIRFLGGAPLLYIAFSLHVIDDAPGCSPCVPNAGDLDSYYRGARGSTQCYTVPADWLYKED
jgi:hypothetical protein